MMLWPSVQSALTHEKGDAADIATKADELVAAVVERRNQAAAFAHKSGQERLPPEKTQEARPCTGSTRVKKRAGVQVFPRAVRGGFRVGGASLGRIWGVSGPYLGRIWAVSSEYLVSIW